MDIITKDRLDKHYRITKEAVEKAKSSKSRFNENIKNDFLNMIESYFKDAKYLEVILNQLSLSLQSYIIQVLFLLLVDSLFQLL